MSATSASEFTCRLCGSQTFSVLVGHEAWHKTAEAMGEGYARLSGVVRNDPRLDFGALVRCAGCGLRQVARVPNEEALNSFYQAYYGNAHYAAKKEKKIARATRRLRAIVRQATGARFLDIGCNQGYAVEAARRLGLYATGIEVDATAVRAAQAQFQGARFLHKTAEQMAQGSDRFDFLYCSEVIEHVRDPRSFMSALSTLAAPGAILFLTTPDGGHWRVPKQFARWREVKPPEHLVWFDKTTLGDLARAHGWSVRFEWNLKPGIRMIGRKV